MIAVTVPHEPKKRPQADPSSAPVVTATKALIAPPVPLERSVDLVRTQTDQLTVHPVGMNLAGMNHAGNLRHGAVMKNPLPRARTVEVVMTARPAMIVDHAMIDPHAGSLRIVAAIKPTRSPRGQLPLAPTGMNVPLVATHPSAAVIVTRTHHAPPALTPHDPSQAVVMIDRRAEITMTVPPAVTVTTVLRAETTLRVRIADRESHRDVPSRASLPHPAVIETRRRPITTIRNRPVPSQ